MSPAKDDDYSLLPVTRRPQQQQNLHRSGSRSSFGIDGRKHEHGNSRPAQPESSLYFDATATLSSGGTHPVQEMSLDIRPTPQPTLIDRAVRSTGETYEQDKGEMEGEGEEEAAVSICFSNTEAAPEATNNVCIIQNNGVTHERSRATSSLIQRHQQPSPRSLTRAPSGKASEKGTTNNTGTVASSAPSISSTTATLERENKEVGNDDNSDNDDYNDNDNYNGGDTVRYQHQVGHTATTDPVSVVNSIDCDGDNDSWSSLSEDSSSNNNNKHKHTALFLGHPPAGRAPEEADDWAGSALYGSDDECTAYEREQKDRKGPPPGSGAHESMIKLKTKKLLTSSHITTSNRRGSSDGARKVHHEGGLPSKTDRIGTGGSGRKGGGSVKLRRIQEARHVAQRVNHNPSGGSLPHHHHHDALVGRGSSSTMATPATTAAAGDPKRVFSISRWV